MEMTPKKIVTLAYDCCLVAVKAKSDDEIITIRLVLDSVMTSANVKSDIIDWIGNQIFVAYVTHTIPEPYDMLNDLSEKVKI